MKFERLKYKYKGKDYIYELCNNRNKYWIAFFGDFEGFPTKKEALNYVSKHGDDIISDYLEFFPDYKGNGEGLLPTDDEEREMMFTAYDEENALYGEELQDYILELEGVKRTRYLNSQKKNVTFRLDIEDIEKMKKIASEEGIPYQTLIGAIIHKVANKKIELTLK